MSALALTPAPALDRLLPISLPQLLSQAELMSRVDRKYLLASTALDVLLSELTADCAVLEIDGVRRFGYTSTYWDTPELAAFELAGRGRRRRFKVRTRRYDESGESYLEVKTRGARDRTVKTRIPYAATSPQLDSRAIEFVTEALTAAGVSGIDPARLRPSLTTTYQRSTLVTADSAGRPARATIDTALTWSSAERPASLAAPQLAIVETKGSTQASPVDRALWRLGHRPLRVSKYGTGLALLHTELPNLKWHNVISRNFTTLTTHQEISA